MSGETSAITFTVEPVATSVGAPDLIEPIVGFRNWRIFRDGPRYGELSSRTCRSHGPNESNGRSAGVEAASRSCCGNLIGRRTPGCGCGISAYHAPTGDFSKVDFRAVSGIVTVWGAIEVDGDEMRAEVARIEALALYHRWTRDQLEAVRAIAEPAGHGSDRPEGARRGR